MIVRKCHNLTVGLIPGDGKAFDDVVSLLVDLGAAIETSREGSRVGIVLSGEVRVLHKPHPSPNMDKGAVAALRDWLERQGVTP